MINVDKEKMDYLNDLSKKIVNCIYNVHKELGPGLLERAYQISLCRELELCNFSYDSEFMIPLIYKGQNIESGYRLDIIVENEIIIEIIDSGVGIDKKNIEHITDPFYTTQPPGEGTGLGLTIAYTIITEHKGTIEFESELGVGTKVIIRLPNNLKMNYNEGKS